MSVLATPSSAELGMVLGSTQDTKVALEVLWLDTRRTAGWVRPVHHKLKHPLQSDTETRLDARVIESPSERKLKHPDALSTVITCNGYTRTFVYNSDTDVWEDANKTMQPSYLTFDEFPVAHLAPLVYDPPRITQPRQWVDVAHSGVKAERWKLTADGNTHRETQAPPRSAGNKRVGPGGVGALTYRLGSLSLGRRTAAAAGKLRAGVRH